MNEDLQKKLEMLGSDLIEKVQTGAIWATEQTALFIKEFVAVHIIEHSIYFLLWSLPSILCLFLYKKANKHIEGVLAKLGDKVNVSAHLSNSNGFVYIGRHFLVPIAVIIWCLNLGFNATEIAKGVFAPRVVLIEKLNATFRGNVR